MNKLLWVAAVAVLSGAGFAGQAWSQDAAPPAPAPAPDPFEQAMAAAKVADFGRRQKDPQALIVAARMLQEIPIADRPCSAAPDGPPPAFSPAALFGEAKVLANGDKLLLMQINVAESSGGKGVLSSAFGTGLVRIVQDMAARQVYAFAIKAKAGEVLRIGAIGDIKTQMLMRLRDRSGKVVCVDDNADYAPVCSVKPGAAADYKVEIVNHSNAPSRTVILSN